MNKLTLSTIITAMLFSGIANAEYMIKIPLEQSNGGFLPNNSIIMIGGTGGGTGAGEEAGNSNDGSNEQPVEEVYFCDEPTNNVINYASSIGVNLTIYSSYYGDECSMDIEGDGIYSFQTEEQLRQVGQYIASLPVKASSVVYGFPDGSGRFLVWNDIVDTSMWYER